MSRMSRGVVVSVLVAFSGAAAIVLGAASARVVAASAPHFSEFRCPSNPALTCVMSGLHNPRGLAFGPEGALYVAEAGCGGNTSDCKTPPPLANCTQLPFAGDFITRCFGLTGSITRLWQGTQERVATGFPSVAFPLGASAIGPNDVSLHGLGNLYATIGLQYDPTFRDQLELGPLFAQLVHVPANALSATSKHAERREFNTDWLVADLGNFEITVNPDNGDIDTNPYGLLSAPGVGWIVTDAGGNSLLQVDHQGNISLLATFQSRGSTPPRPSFAPPALNQTTDAVPTSVAIGPDGAYYVAELTGVPFTDKRANIYRVVPGETPREFFIEDAFLTGFKMIIDIAFDDEGNLYVVQNATGALQQAGLGVLIRVTPDKDQPDIYSQYRNGTRQTILSGLTRPTSVAVGPDGALYISRGTTAVGGEVIRFEPPVQ
jgi:hypothetical protein